MRPRPLPTGGGEGGTVTTEWECTNARPPSSLVRPGRSSTCARWHPIGGADGRTSASPPPPRRESANRRELVGGGNRERRPADIPPPGSRGLDSVSDALSVPLRGRRLRRQRRRRVRDRGKGGNSSKDAVVEVSGIAERNMFRWNSIIIPVDEGGRLGRGPRIARWR